MPTIKFGETFFILLLLIFGWLKLLIPNPASQNRKIAKSQNRKIAKSQNRKIVWRKLAEITHQARFLRYFCYYFLNITFADFFLLTRVCTSLSVHWYQINTIITQNQFVYVTRVVRAARFNNVESTNASFAHAFF